MTITAKYPGKCNACNGAINRGDVIEWTKRGGAAHKACNNPRMETENQQAAARHDLKCWTCDSTQASFRNEGAAAPVRCDACQAIAEKAKRKARGDCPTCGGSMPRSYAAKGYQCDNCADRDEGKISSAW